MDIVLRCACALEAAQQGDMARAKRLMEEARKLMALVLDCFDHTPWTSAASVSSALSAQEVLLNAGALGSWVAQSSSGGGFAGPRCAVELPPTCFLAPNRRQRNLGVDMSTAEVFVQGSRSFTAYLHQCGDSYGEWRQIQVGPLEGRKTGSAWILHMSSLAMSNLWHLLHILLPALAREEQVEELLIDGLADADITRLRQSLAWPFLEALGDPQVLGLGLPGRRCYGRALWGYEAVSLFGRHKGRPLPQAAQRLRSIFGAPRLPRTPRLLLAERRAGARSVANAAALHELLAALPLRITAADLGRWSVVEQWRVASGARILLGAHGAGLAWAAFMEVGSVLVELMPYMKALHQQLCRVKRGEVVAWDATPMYAYGGLALVAQLHHACILGLPGPGAPQSLGADLATWWSSSILVDLKAVNSTLRTAIRLLNTWRRGS